MSAGERPCTPVFGVVAHPVHVLWVPIELWLLNIVAATIAGVAVGMADGTGIRSELTAVVGIAGHLWFARAFRRDRHVVGVWRARYGGGPMAPSRSVRMLLARRRGLMVMEP